MSEAGSFRTVLRGYEPAQVDQRVGELVRDLHASQDRVAELGRDVEALQRDLAERRSAGAEGPQGASDYTGLGVRIGQMLALAEEEAAALLAGAEADAGAARREAEAACRLLRAEADRYGAEVRERADRIRAESERELSAASQRRDSINAQLAHVRQVLAAMSGSAPVAPAPTAAVLDVRGEREGAVRAG